MRYSLLNSNLSTLAGQLGINYDTLIKYRTTDPFTYQQQMSLVESANNGTGENKLSKLNSFLNNPILDRYMTISYFDQQGKYHFCYFEDFVFQCKFIYGSLCCYIGSIR